MTIFFDNVYIKDVSTVAGKDENEGNLGNLFDKTYDDYYVGEKTFEQAEMKMIKDSVYIALNKTKLSLNDIDVVIGADLSNQITLNTYEAVKFERPYLGLYNACASLCEEFIVGSSLLQNGNVNNVLLNVSSHNMTAERQFRNPVEYGAPKPKRSTFTCTGSASCIISKDKTNVKVTSATIGTPVDLGVNDVFDMGSVMAPSAAKSIFEHLKNTNTKVEDYDLILTGDLGIYGKEILREYMKKEYKVDLKNKYEDSGSIIYNREKQTKVKAGGSGPVCIGLVAYSKILNELREKKLKKVLLVATGALMSPVMNNQKLTIPSISHAVCLEAI